MADNNIPEFGTPVLDTNGKPVRAVPATDIPEFGTPVKDIPEFGTPVKTDSNIPEFGTPVVEPKSELSDEITPEEITAIAAKNNLNPTQAQKLKSYANFFGTSVKGEESNLVNQAGGFLSDAVGLGLPQKYIIETADTEQEKNAYDDLRHLAEQRKSGKRIAAEIGTSLLVPGGGAFKLLEGAGKIAKIAGTAGLVGTEFAAHARRGEELEKFGIGAGVGAAGGLLLEPLISKIIGAGKGIKSQFAANAIKEQVEKIPDLEQQIQNKFDRRLVQTNLEKKIIRGEQLAPEEKIQLLGNNILPENPEDITKLLEAKTEQITKAFEKDQHKSLSELKNEGADFLDRQYDRFVKKELAPEVVTESGIKNNLVALTDYKGLLLKLSDNKPLAKIIDKRLGSDVEQILDNLSDKANQYTNVLGSVLPEVNTLRTTARKLGVNNDDLYNALDTGKNAANIDNKLLDSWKQFWEKNRLAANEMGMDIPKLTNYVPKKRLSLVPYTSAIKNRVRLLETENGINLRNLEPEQFDRLLNVPEFQELAAEVGYQAGVKKLDSSLFAETLNKMMTDTSFNSTKLAIDAFTAKAREGKIPDFVLEKDVGNLANKWLQSTYRTLILRDEIEELKRAADLAGKAGDVFSEKHLKDLVQDLIGTRSDTLGAKGKQLANTFLIAAQERADKATNPITKKMWESAVETPKFLNTVMRNIYTNVLGLSPKPAIQNLTTPSLFIVPDMGYKYGAGKYAESFSDILSTTAKGVDIKLSNTMARALNKRPGEIIKTKDLNMVMQNAGIIPKQWNSEMISAMQDGIKSTMVGDAARNVLEKYTHAAMFLFEKSELIARANGYFMGQRIGKDLVKNPKFAAEFIKNLDSSSYQRALTKALKTNPETVPDIMTKYLNSNYLFNYDRVNMSAYGRYMGPLFSIFSKWPTSIAGRIMSDYYRNGAGNASLTTARTLLLPFAALATADHFLGEQENSPVFQKLVGKRGLKGWAPIDAVSPLFDRGIVSSPVGQAVSSLYDSATKPNKKLNNAVQDIIGTYGFGSGLLRFLGEDLAIYKGEPKPEGPRIERQVKGIRDLLK